MLRGQLKYQVPKDWVIISEEKQELNRVIRTYKRKGKSWITKAQVKVCLKECWNYYEPLVKFIEYRLLLLFIIIINKYNDSFNLLKRHVELVTGEETDDFCFLTSLW